MDFSFAHDLESQDTSASDETEAFLDLMVVSPLDDKEPETPYLKCMDGQQGYENIINEIRSDRGMEIEVDTENSTLSQTIVV